MRGEREVVYAEVSEEIESRERESNHSRRSLEEEEKFGGEVEELGKARSKYEEARDKTGRVKWRGLRSMLVKWI